MATQHDKQFKLDAIQYYQDRKDIGVRGCVENLGIGYSTLTKWLKDFRESGDILARGSGNYASDEQKEIARVDKLNWQINSSDLLNSSEKTLVDWVSKSAIKQNRKAVSIEYSLDIAALMHFHARYQNKSK